jgi:hypothetical protein
LKRFNGIEKAGILLASMLIIGGACLAIHPTELNVVQGTGRFASSLEHVSKDGARFAGCVSIAFGVGFAAFALCRSRE